MDADGLPVNPWEDEFDAYPAGASIKLNVAVGVPPAMMYPVSVPLEYDDEERFVDVSEDEVQDVNVKVHVTK